MEQAADGQRITLAAQVVECLFEGLQLIALRRWRMGGPSQMSSSRRATAPLPASCLRV